MTDWQLPKLAAASDGQIEDFRRDGYLVVERVLDGAQVEALRDRFEPLFRGEFETGIFPDEWHWREGVSLPNATRHMCNAWKSDLTIARMALSADIARFAGALQGWDSIRLGQDTLWVKTPQATETVLHQDASFLSFLEPARSVTCWTTLDDTKAGAGTIEYVPGSHHWPIAELPRDFMAPEGGYRARMLAAAEAAGIAAPTPVEIEVPAGSMVFHAGQIWHGSGTNASPDIIRRAVGVHMLPAEVRFNATGGGYIYGRYRRRGETALDETPFPILWSQDGTRTEFLTGYLADGRID